LTFFITVLPIPATKLTSSDGAETVPLTVVSLLSDLLLPDVTCGFVKGVVVVCSLLVVTFSGFVVTCSGLVVVFSLFVVTFSGVVTFGLVVTTGVVVSGTSTWSLPLPYSLISYTESPYPVKRSLQ